MCESIVVVGAALSADVDAPTERVHSAPGARRGQSPKQPTGGEAVAVGARSAEGAQKGDCASHTVGFPRLPIVVADDAGALSRLNHRAGGA